MTYINPKIVNIPDPKGLDLAISGAQSLLGGLTWMTKVFGRAHPFIDYEGEGKRLVTTSQGIKPKVFESRVSSGKDANYYTVFENDNLNAYCFFVAEGPAVANEFTNTGRNIWTRPMSLISWYRLNKIDSTKAYNFTEELIEETISKLKLDQKIKISNYVDDTRDVWDGFEVPENKNFRYPNTGSRIYFDLTYLESC